MLRIDANHPNHALAVNDLALITDFLYGSPDFHVDQSLFIPVDNPAPGKVVGRELYGNLVARKYPDEVFPHFPGNMSQDHVFAFQLDTEHRVGQRLQHCRDNFNCFFFGHAVVA